MAKNGGNRGAGRRGADRADDAVAMSNQTGGERGTPVDWIRSGVTAVVAEDATAASPGSGGARRLTKGLVCQVLHTVGDSVYLQPRSIPWNTDETDEQLDLPDNPCRLSRSLVRRPNPQHERFLQTPSSSTDDNAGADASAAGAVCCGGSMGCGCCGEEEEESQTLRGTVSHGSILSALRSKSLPDDVAIQVASFLTVDNVTFDEVAVSHASSSRGDFPLENVLQNKSGTWWISAEGTMRCRGEEYIQFKLSPDGTIRRVSFFGLSIPPMPYGPLSVRHFRLDWSVDGKRWIKGGKDHTMETIDMDGIQAFELSPVVDAAYLRLVCLQNVIWAERFHSSLEGGGPGRPVWTASVCTTSE